VDAWPKLNAGGATIETDVFDVMQQTLSSFPFIATHLYPSIADWTLYAVAFNFIVPLLLSRFDFF